MEQIIKHINKIESYSKYLLDESNGILYGKNKSRFIQSYKE